jgi:thiosulfate dehydrogenase [quinone] large subunit
MTSNKARRLKAADRSGEAAVQLSTPDTMWRLRGPDGSIGMGWCLIPLRAFLGVTFLYAGLQKLANPDFFRGSSPISFHSQMVGASHTSPLGSLIAHLVGNAPVLGLLIALGEVAVGVGALLGLLTRVAAVGGMLVSLSLFLCISYHSSPYYVGSDIVFLFAWTPLLLAGASGAPALDTWLALRSDAREAVGVDHATAAPVVSRGAAIGIVAGTAAVLVGAAAGLGRSFGTSSTPSTSSTGSTPVPSSTPVTSPTAGGGAATTPAPLPNGTSIGPATDVPVGGSAAFTDPSTGDPSLVIQHKSGQFVAFDAICPHAGCTVAYQPGANIITCPCHGSEFNPGTGAVMVGPATTGLTPIKVIAGSNGKLYVV